VTSRVHLRVSGYVQGVGFRYTARRQAERLGLTGWVRNAADGTVEAEVQGPTEEVQSFVVWISRGPAGADVHDVQREEIPALSGENAFRIVT
jgi:acylphosphatase